MHNFKVGEIVLYAPSSYQLEKQRIVKIHEDGLIESVPLNSWQDRSIPIEACNYKPLSPEWDE